MTTLLVTGTGTGVGKTIVIAAIAALAVEGGARVTVVKPAQTGVPDGSGGDLTEVRRLVPKARTVELARYPDPLSPEAAARRCGRAPLTLTQCTEAIRAAAADADLTLVEGAGGLLVRYDPDGLTIADVAGALDLPVVLVVGAGLGTLNATALTIEALRARRLALHAVVVGSWPGRPDLAERSNLRDLPVVADRPLSGVLPAGSSRRQPTAFMELARQGLAPGFGGAFDPDVFAHSVRA